MTQPMRRGLLLLTLGILCAGCGKAETAIRTYSAPKDPPAPQVASADQSPQELPGADQTVRGDSAENSGPPLTWTVPADWKAVKGSSNMRFATFQVSAADPKAQLTVVPLPMEAAAVLPNVARWAGQLKLPEVTEADLPKYVKQAEVSGEQVSMVDMTGSAETGNPPTRLLAAIVPHEGRAWFFTLKAAEPTAAAQKANFEQFIRSIQFPAGEAAPPDSSAAEHTFGSSTQSDKLAKWKTPEGWQEQPGSKGMQVTAFRIGAPEDATELVVSRIPQRAIGSFVNKINGWREEVGLSPVESDRDAGFQPVAIGDKPGLVLSLTGPRTPTQSGRQALVALTIRGADGWFFEMIGPESVVSKQQDAFKQFLESLQFEPESH